MHHMTFLEVLHARIQTVLSEGSNVDKFLLLFFLVEKGRENPNTTLQSRDKMPLYFKTIAAVNSTYINTLSVWLSK